MAAAIGALGPILSIAGTVVGVVGQLKQAKALKEAEKLRERQMNLEAQRQRDEILRRAQIARATVAANAANQGVGQGSTAVIGGEQAATSQGDRQTLAVNQNQEIGANIFGQNRNYASAGSLVGVGSGLVSLSGAFSGSNLGTFERIGLIT